MTAQAEPGDVFADRYLVRALLGEGGMASVYSAEDRLLERMVAVKVLRPGTHSSFERFLQEARALAALDSPHLVPLYDAGWHGEEPYLVMKLLSGRTLRDLVPFGVGLPSPRAIAMIAQVLKGLSHIHRRGLLHRDVKPENVFVAADDHVTLVDLGIAFHGARDILPPGAVVGTPRYMAPEQAEGEAGDQRIDIYAAGLLLHEALSGRPRYGDAGNGTTVEGGLPPQLAVSDEELPENLAAVVRKATDPDPERRFQSAAEMRAALLHLSL